MIRKGCSLTCLFSMALLFSSWFWKQDSSGALNHFLHKASRVIEKKYNLETCTTGGSVVGGVSKVTLRFTCENLVDVPEARRYIVGVVEDVFYMANTNKHLHPFLKDGYIPKESIDIAIYFESCSFGKIYPSQPFICTAEIIGKNIFYKSRDSHTDRFKREHKELYEEARKIVLGEKAADEGSSSSL